MLQATKIFHFEMAHAIHDHKGACGNIHGHSYELHVTVTSTVPEDAYITSPGMLIDFKDLKSMVNRAVIEKLDHKIALSRAYLDKGPATSFKNLLQMEVEPSAENLLIYAKKSIEQILPEGINLLALRLFETKDSYAEWVRYPIAGEI
ncbi:MAG: 6-carboxytetrahydropterin synthase [Chitinophagaceae bacterium]|nr:6-carboxytetrahydropterin synthase [Chitinophagaceae bacterium]